MLLLNHFTELTDAPGAAAHLRRLILDLAVRGKLVPQDQNDEPASVLLNKIRAKREQLIAAKLLKPERAPSGINGRKEPYSIPSGWSWIALGEVTNVTKLAGFEYTKILKPNMSKDGEVPLVRAQNVKPNKLLKTSLLYTDLKTSEELKRSALYEPSLLITFIGAGIGEVASFEESQRWQLAPNVAKAVPIDNDLVSLKFLMWTLLSMHGQSEFKLAQKETAQPSLSMKTIRAVRLGLPPLHEQNRIVEKLDDIFKILTDLEASNADQLSIVNRATKALLNGLTQSQNLSTYWQRTIVPNFHLFTRRPEYCDHLRRLILDLAVRGKLVSQDPNDEPADQLLKRIQADRARRVKAGELRKSKVLPPVTEQEVPYDLPEGWVWCRLGNLASKMGSGSTPRGGKSAYVSSGYPFLRSQNILHDSITLDEVARISQATHNAMSGTVVYPGDVLLNITGGSLGRCARVYDEFEEANVSQHVSIIRPIEVNPDYLVLTIRSRLIQSQIFESVTGAGREGLPKYNQQKLLVPLPPLAEQSRIVVRAKQMIQQVDEILMITHRKTDLKEKIWQSLLANAAAPVDII